MIEALRNNAFSTVIGTLTFDSKGDVEQEAYVFYRWSQGTYSEVVPAPVGQ